MAKRKEKFPKQIYVGFDSNGNEKWMNASETPEGLEVTNDVREIGIYELVRVANLKNTTEVV